MYFHSEPINFENTEITSQEAAYFESVMSTIGQYRSKRILLTNMNSNGGNTEIIRRILLKQNFEGLYKIGELGYKHCWILLNYFLSKPEIRKDMCQKRPVNCRSEPFDDDVLRQFDHENAHIRQKALDNLKKVIPYLECWQLDFESRISRWGTESMKRALLKPPVRLQMPQPAQRFAASLYNPGNRNIIYGNPIPGRQHATSPSSIPMNMQRLEVNDNFCFLVMTEDGPKRYYKNIIQTSQNYSSIPCVQEDRPLSVQGNLSSWAQVPVYTGIPVPNVLHYSPDLYQSPIAIDWSSFPVFKSIPEAQEQITADHQQGARAYSDSQFLPQLGLFHRHENPANQETAKPDPMHWQPIG